MKTLMQKRWFLPTVSAVLLLLLFLKQCWSLVRFPGVPFGYDAGIYRYLFLKHAQGFPPFSIVDMPSWAHGHPLGLYFFSTLLIRLGVQVDWLIGWIWNLFPILIAVVLARVFAKREGAIVGVLVLLAYLLSTVQYQGFLLMYWKVFAALLWCALSFSFFERKSLLWILLAMLSIATHQQIGLVLILAILSSIILRERSRLLQSLAELAVAVTLGLLWYIPNAQGALFDIVPNLINPTIGFALVAGAILLGGFAFVFVRFPRHRRSILFSVAACVGLALLLLPITGHAPTFLGNFLKHIATTDAVPGVFFTVPEYLEKSLPLLLLALTGLVLSFRREQGTVWQCAAIWCALAVVSMFFFYRRFLLPLDFFLLPFAAVAMAEAWRSQSDLARGAVVVAVMLQGWLALDQISVIDPHVDHAMLAQFAELPKVVTPHRYLIVLDNMAPWVTGFLPDNVVSGPGIFSSFPIEDWQKFLYGSSADHHEFIVRYPRGTYFFATDVFRSFYPPEVQSLLADPCFRPTSMTGLLESACGVDPASKP